MQDVGRHQRLLGSLGSGCSGCNSLCGLRAEGLAILMRLDISGLQGSGNVFGACSLTAFPSVEGLKMVLFACGVVVVVRFRVPKKRRQTWGLTWLLGATSCL